MDQSFRFGDLPEHGGWARRIRAKMDRTCRARRRLLPNQGKRYAWRSVCKWRNAGNRWYVKLQKELLRQEPHQTGWTAP